MVNAVESPVSCVTIQLRSLLHIPLIGAKPTAKLFFLNFEMKKMALQIILNKHMYGTSF